MNFLFRYCGAYHDGWGLRYDRATNTEELNRILTDEVMHRVLKKDVLTQLPDKVHTVVPFQMIDGRLHREYRLAAGGLKQKLSGGFKYVDALAKLSEMRDLAVSGKFDQVLQWIRDFLDSDEKLVVYAVHHKVIDGLMSEFKSMAVKLDGRDSMQARAVSIERFQTDDSVRLFVANIEAGGIGIDGLQNAASNVAFVELPWVPASLDQAADRLHRMGQKDSVQVYLLIAENTIEEHMAAVMDDKRKMVDAVLDGRETPESSMITELLKRIREE